MADSTTPLDLISQSVSQPATAANNLFDPASPAILFGRRAATTAALTWGYYGGRFNGTSVANGTVALTASNTNYVVVHRTTLAVSVSTATTNWNDTTTYGRAYKITTGTATVSSYEDHRMGSSGILTPVIPAASDMVGDTGTGGTHGLVPAPAAGDAAAGKFLDAGGAWSVPAGGGGGGGGVETLISEVTTSATQANVTFSSIPATYRDLHIRVRAIAQTGGGQASLRMQINGDTAANYTWGGSVSSTGTTYFLIGGLSTLSGNSETGAIIDILGYRSTTEHKPILSSSCAWLPDYPSPAALYSHGTWHSIAAISSVAIYFDGCNIKDGSIVSLYGRM